MKMKLYLFSLLILLFFTFCNENDDDDNTPTSSIDIEINNDSATLNKRLDYTNSGVISVDNSSKTKSLSSQSVTDLPLVQIAEVNAPIDQSGRTLQANHVAVHGSYIYVAYTMSGNIYSGAIDLIDITDPYKPKVLSSALIADTDITSLNYSNGHLIIAAARDIDKDPSLTSPAIILNMQLNAGMLTENYTVNKLEGQVTTDVASNSVHYFGVTGDAGSLFKINEGSQSLNGKVPLEDLRTVAIDGSKVVTLSWHKRHQYF
ncbi:hypothetical protein ACQ9BO_16730 [Flavobacterium sp. P21]|uniref:hypothetical protein n=1 Tax=Flavobacterium sp. P21 TaxID=3423948 RepID=UPI003D6710E9